MAGADRPRVLALTHSLSEIDGVVSFGKIKRGNREVIVTAKDDQTRKYLIGLSKHILVQEGDFVRAGTPLSDGATAPKDILNILHFKNITIYNYTQMNVTDDAPFYKRKAKKQQGAKQAMIDPFKHGWFEAYDWVIRLNPDVLVRREKWIRQTMLNTSIDAMLVYNDAANVYHSDFCEDVHRLRW